MNLVVLALICTLVHDTLSKSSESAFAGAAETEGHKEEFFSFIIVSYLHGST